MSLTHTLPEPRVTSVGDFFALLKPRLMSLVVFTGLSGMVAAPGALHPLTAFTALLFMLVGWIAGLVNAFPVESVQLFELARDGRFEEARILYEWFLPLLRLDTVPKFVQLIKLVQAELGRGTATVRPPRLALDAGETAPVRALVRERLANRPAVASRAAGEKAVAV